MRDLGFFDIGQIAKLESGVTTRTIRNRVAAGRFPPPDAIVDGVPRWLVATYEKYTAAVLAGDYVGRDRVAQMRCSAAVA
jgi:hypothetical protein